MTKRSPIHAVWVIFLSLILSYSLSWAETKPVGFAIPFPDLTFTQTLSKGEQVHLGIPQKKTLSFEEIRGNLILI